MNAATENKKVLQGKKTREKLLEAAARCFAEKGYSGCSMETLVQASGMSKGCIYAHFKSKEELFLTMIRREHLQASERALAVLAKPPFLDGLIWHMGECIRNAGFPMDHRLWAEVLAVAARDPAMKAVFLESEKGSRTIMKTLLQKAMDNHEIDPELDLEAISILLFALGDGLIIRIADDPDFDFDRQFGTFEAAVRNILKPRLRP